MVLWWTIIKEVLDILVCMIYTQQGARFGLWLGWRRQGRGDHDLHLWDLERVKVYSFFDVGWMYRYWCFSLYLSFEDEKGEIYIPQCTCNVLAFFDWTVFFLYLFEYRYLHSLLFVYSFLCFITAYDLNGRQSVFSLTWLNMYTTLRMNIFSSSIMARENAIRMARANGTRNYR